jgi:predicted Zn-dependent protease
MKTALRQTVRLAHAALLGALFTLGMTGCQMVTEPYTGRRQLILSSPAKEMQMSLEAWQEVVKTEKPSSNPEFCKAVTRVGEAIRAVAEQPDFEWEFRCFASKNANAFCLPGGKVAAYDGLLPFLDNDAELATVIGHEIGHAIARHGGERMTEAMLVGIGAAGLGVALNDKSAEERQRWLAAYAGISTIGFLLPYSRKHEYAADEIGLMLMAKAGYNPEAALSFWEKFGANSKANALTEFLSTHPIGKKRLARLESMMVKASLEYEMTPVRRGGHGLGEIYAK